MTKHIDLQAKPFALDEAQIQWVEETLAGMTLDEKIGQLFCPIALGPEPGQLDTVLDTLHPGGMLFRAMDAKTIQDAQRYLQQKSRIPLLLAANLEAGGNGNGLQLGVFPDSRYQPQSAEPDHERAHLRRRSRAHHPHGEGVHQRRARA